MSLGASWVVFNFCPNVRKFKQCLTSFCHATYFCGCWIEVLVPIFSYCLLFFCSIYEFSIVHFKTSGWSKLFFQVGNAIENELSINLDLWWAPPSVKLLFLILNQYLIEFSTPCYFIVVPTSQAANWLAFGSKFE